MPYPIEYREGAAQVMTQFLLKGQNPFSLENQPLGTNNYGIVYSLSVLPFATLFGNSLLVHRIVTFIFIILSCLLIFQTISKVNSDRFFALSGAAFIMMGLVARGGVGAYPAAMGVVLFLAGILIPFNRNFNNLALFLSAVLCVIAFYTKPYFVLSFGIVASYIFVFVSKRKGLFFCLLFGVSFIISYLLVRYIYVLYFIDTFLSNLNQTQYDSLGYMTGQVMEFSKEFCPILILGLILLILNVNVVYLKKVSLKSFLGCFNILSLDRPLISKPLNYLAFIFIINALTYILVLGWNPGSNMNYIYQLLLPPLFLLLFQNIKPSTRFTLISFSLVLINMIMFSLLRLNPGFLQQRDSREWVMLYQSMENSRYILNSPVQTSEMIRLGIPAVDSGQTEFYYAIFPYPDNKLLGPNYRVVKNDGKKYQESIHRSVINLEYDKIFLTPLLKNFFVPDDLSQYYHQTNTIIVEMPQTDQRWTVEIWDPNTK